MTATTQFTGSRDELFAPKANGRQIQPLVVLTLLLSIVLEGAMRKWFLPVPLHGLAYFAKDAVATYIIFLYPRAPNYLAKAAHSLGTANALLLLIPFMLGLISDPVAAAVVYKNAVLWPIVASRLLGGLSYKPMSKVLLYVTLISAGECVLSLYQYFSSAQSVLNQYVNPEDSANIAVFGQDGRVRVCGTFSFLTGLGAWSELAGLLLLSTYVVQFSPQKSRWYLLGAIGAFISIFCTGSRAPVVISLAATGLALVLAAKTKAISRIAVPVFLLVAVFSLTALSNVTKNFNERVFGEGTDRFEDRVAVNFEAISESFLSAPLGQGLGGQSTMHSFQSGALVGAAEDNRERIAIDGGLFGLISFGNILWVLGRAFIELRRKASSNVKFAVYSFGVAGALIAFTGILYYDHVTTALFWVLLSLGLSVLLSMSQARSGKIADHA